MPEYRFYVWLEGCAEVVIHADSYAEAAAVLDNDGMGAPEFRQAFDEVAWDWNHHDVERDGEPFAPDDEEEKEAA